MRNTAPHHLYTFSSQGRYERALSIMGDVWQQRQELPEWYGTTASYMLEIVTFHSDKHR